SLLEMRDMSAERCAADMMSIVHCAPPRSRVPMAGPWLDGLLGFRNETFCNGSQTLAAVVAWVLEAPAGIGPVGNRQEDSRGSHARSTVLRPEGHPDRGY